MKKFTVNCDFGGQIAPFSIYIGKPEQGHHPLHFQADWLSKNRGGTIPVEVMNAVTQLQELANKNGVLLEELCVYALGTQDQQTELQDPDQEEANPDQEAAVPKEEDIPIGSIETESKPKEIKTKKTKKPKVSDA